jgi:hypothetical protein
MRKILTVLVIGMLVMIGSTTLVLGEDDTSNTTNRAPKAPILVQEKTDLKEENYRCTFYSIDPDGDQVYYYISWKKIEEDIKLCEPDEPVRPWYGPFDSGEEFAKDHTFMETGTYKVTLIAKDIHDKVGPATEITVTYKKVKMFQLPILLQLLEKFPIINSILKDICKL